jgi:hypothetical protein
MFITFSNFNDKVREALAARELEVVRFTVTQAGGLASCALLFSRSKSSCLFRNGL